jgi:hypothetical protein
MHRAFIRTEDDTRRLGRAYNVSGSNVTGNVNDLRGYRHGAGNVTTINLNHAQDEYERLAAAVSYYNSGTHLVGNSRRSWPSILKYLEFSPNSVSNAGAVCHSCRYSIQVRETVFGENLRTYIWQGGTGTDGQPWCFAYGEREWVSGATFTQARQAASDTNLDGAPQTPVGRIGCN